MFKQAEKSVCELLDVMKPEQICIENLEVAPYPLPCVDVIRKLGTGMCYDVGHAVMGGLDSVEFFDQHRDVIRHIHFHDILVDEKGRRSDHHGLGEGLMDKERFLSALTERNYQGVMLLEVNSYANAKQSVDYLQKTGFFIPRRV